MHIFQNYPSRRAPATSQSGLVFLFALLALGCNPRTPTGPTSRTAESRTATRAAKPTLTLMSFNIRYGTADDGANAWPHRHEHVFETIRKYAPDIVGVQEALRFQLDEILAALPRYESFGVGRDDGRQAGEYAAILYDRERLERVAGNTFWFSDTPEKTCSTSWGNTLCRICTWARFRERSTGAHFYVYNVHLDHASATSRLRSAELLIDRVRQRHPLDPVFITGDFNAGESNPPILAIKRATIPSSSDDNASDASLVDSYRVMNPQVEHVGTFNAFKGEANGAKIDYVFVEKNAVEVIEADIARDAFDGAFPSDHFPVWARVRLR